uniref:Putative ovule protein n=1 Tax=Solanum chacoense TaxID=4108 RepID=A0A0V0GHZ6_SOLCH
MEAKKVQHHLRQLWQPTPNYSEFSPVFSSRSITFTPQPTGCLEIAPPDIEERSVGLESSFPQSTPCYPQSLS